ncbi:MAG: ABC transporter permease [Bacteroidales bacterium]|nr:ABC transporter permease [Bacteroidales bacterium]
MYWNYLKSGFRNLYRNKLFSVINITGFSLGLAVFFLIVLWINYEVGFDRFHKNAKNIYRVVAEFDQNGIVDNFANTPAPLGPALKEEFPNVIEYTRCAQIEKNFIISGNNQFWENLFFADEGIFKVFSLKLRAGNTANILSSPSNVIISQRVAEKYFRDENPIGKTISIGINNQSTFTIAGVLEDVPSNSQFKIDFLLPFNNLSRNSGWDIWNYTTYILVDKQNDYKSLESKLQWFTKMYQLDPTTKLHLQPFVNIHLFSNLRNDLSENVYYPKLILYVAIAIIILLLASINFINLSLAKSTLRNKEIGIRKVIGANKKQLRFQFIGESFIITLISFLISIPFIYYFLPVFNQFVNKNIALSQFLNYGSIAFILVLLLVLTLVNGLYPASVLSSGNPAGILRGNLSIKQNSIKFVRQSFIVFQFVVAIFFISGTLIIKSQLNFIGQKT